MIVPGAYMASVDNKDAYYGISINEEYIKFLNLYWDGKYYAFQCMPSGYGPALRAFTKIIKQPFRYLRSLGHLSVIYVDDYFFLDETFSECHKNVYVTVKLLDMLGFTIHPRKSVLIPTQILVFLGFLLTL